MLHTIGCLVFIMILQWGGASAIDYEGPYNKIWSESQCRRVSVFYTYSVELCKAKCSRLDACDVLSYHTGMKICQLRYCSHPIPEPSYYHPGNVGYAKIIEIPEVATSTSTPEATTAVPTTQQEINTNDFTFLADEGVAPSCECGNLPSTYQYNRIVGGHEVAPMHKYPWHAGLYSGHDYYFCGATILTERHVLTAAHCFAEFAKNSACNIKIRHSLWVGVADHDEARPYDDIEGVTRLILAKNVFIHPKYQCHTYNYDIAMIELEQDLLFGEFLHPVCLPEADTKSYEGEMGLVVGWGDISKANNVYPGKLQEVDVPVMDRECGGYEAIKDDMLCAGYPKTGGKDACSGDSGGSITVQENGRYTQVGIVSYGYGCAEPKYPGVYARVTAIMGWISNITDDLAACTSDLKML